MTKTLLRDINRCSGVIRHNIPIGGGWAAHDLCTHRKTCQRYLAFTEWDKAAGVENYRRISVTMAVQECKIKIDTEEP